MIMIKITHVAMHWKPVAKWCGKSYLLTRTPTWIILDDKQIPAANRYEKEHIHMKLGKIIPAVFKANLNIPPDSTAIAFSYRGSAISSGDDSRGNGWDFWQGP